MPGPPHRLSRRRFCASMVACCCGHCRIGVLEVELAVRLRRRQAALLLTHHFNFQMGSSGASPHRPTRSRARLPPMGEVARSGTPSAPAPARLRTAARGRWPATITTGGSPILT